jgi:hypothetical protein
VGDGLADERVGTRHNDAHVRLRAPTKSTNRSNLATN